MAARYDPNRVEYLDESAVRREMARSFQVCADCRRCADFCPTFRDLFSALSFVGNEADRMTPHMQDQIADPCFECGRCLQGCPHSSSSGVDFPALMIRHRAMARENDLFGLGRKVTDLVRARKNVLKRVVDRVPGVTRSARGEFVEWFNTRPRIRMVKTNGSVAILPSCDAVAESAGIDTVKILEHNGVSCSLLGSVTTCGEELLRIGDIGGFTRVASRNVRELARVVDEGAEIVVLSSRCLEVIRNRYPEFVGGPQTDKVVEHVFGPAEFLVGLHDQQSLDVQFSGERPESVEFRASCSARQTGEAEAAGALLRLAGIAVSSVEACCAGQGCREAVSVPAGEADSEHPVQVLARAYGMARG
ncbi:MAG: 4Fe-4S dicluster domain-containing protein [Ilumatobacteraceae bacterium]